METLRKPILHSVIWVVLVCVASVMAQCPYIGRFEDLGMHLNGKLTESGLSDKFYYFICLYFIFLLREGWGTLVHRDGHSRYWFHQGDDHCNNRNFGIVGDYLVNITYAKYAAIGVYPSTTDQQKLNAFLFFLISINFDRADELLIIISGNGGDPGIWSRRSLVYGSIGAGTHYDYIRTVLQDNAATSRYAVISLPAIPGYAVQVWNTLIWPRLRQFRNIRVLSHSDKVMNALRQHGHDFGYVSRFVLINFYVERGEIMEEFLVSTYVHIHCEEND